MSSMQDRASKVPLRDTLRSLIYLRLWNTACEDAESCIEQYNQAHEEAGACQAFDVLRHLAAQWAVVLDDFVAPIVCRALNDTKLKPVSDPEVQQQLYRGVFLEPNGRCLSAWCKGLPDKYRFLMTLMTKYLANSVNNLRQCMTRLQKDAACLSQFLGKAPGTVTEIQPTGSDGHCNGQVVLILHLSCGKRVVYKPFGGEPAEIYQKFTQLLNNDPLLSGRSIPSVAVHVPDQECKSGNKYHWAEYIPTGPCLTETDVQSFYFRAGATTAAATLLGFSDGHFENVLAARDRPYIIDCETFFQPEFPGETTTEKIMATRLLQKEPQAYSSANGEWNAAFQHPPSAGVATHSFAVSGERTSLMAIHYDIPEKQCQSSAVPTYESEPQMLLHHIPHFLAGYDCACKAAQVLAADRPLSLAECLQPANACIVRFVPRPTSFYIQCLRLLQQPEALTDLACAKRTVEQALLNTRSAQYAQVELSEVTDLLEFDVPAFYMKPSNPNIWYDSKGQAIDMQSSGMKPWDVTSVMDGSAAAALREVMPHLRDEVLCKDPTCDSMVDDSSVLACILAIANEVIMEVFTPGTVPKVSLHHDLYCGMAGILVFLAGAQHMLPDVDIISDACVRIKDAILSNRPSDIVSCGGGFGGPASDAYAIALAGMLVGRPDWVLSAVVLFLEEITLEKISNDTTYDIIGGAAGVVLVGLALYKALEQVQHSSAVMLQLQERVDACGQHLLSKAHRDATGTVTGWACTSISDPACPSPPQPGYAHGIAGIVLALRRLWQFTGDTHYRECATQAVTAEDSMYDVDTHSFSAGSNCDAKSKLRDLHAGCFSWCWGVPGIALGRLGGEPESFPLPAQQLTQHLASAAVVDTTLCCGRLGLLDIYLELRNTGACTEQDIKSAVHEVLKRYTREGSSIFRADDRTGFMRGISGLGYTMLRYLQCDQYPCVLSLSM